MIIYIVAHLYLCLYANMLNRQTIRPHLMKTCLPKNQRICPRINAMLTHMQSISLSQFKT